MARPTNGVISWIGTLVGGLSVVGLSAPHLWTLVPALLVAGLVPLLVTSAGNALNDYLDVEGDRVNHPERPIPRGEIEPLAALQFASTLFGVSLIPLVGLMLFLVPNVISWASWLTLLGIWALSVVLLVSYEYRTKAFGLPGNATVAFLTGAVFLFGGVAVGDAWLALPWLAMAFFATLSREIIKDMEDLEGDRSRKTLPQTRGVPTATVAARASVAAALLLSMVPLLTWLPPTTLAGRAYLGVVVLSDLTFLLSIAWLPRRLHEEQGLSKAAMVLALGAFLGASLH